MREWQNPFISVSWIFFWLLAWHVSELSHAEWDIREALNGRKR